MKKEQLKSELSEKVDANLYAEVEALFAKYGIENIEIKGIEVSSKLDLLNEQDCVKAGGEWVCNNRPGLPPYCRCLGAKNTVKGK